MKVEQMKIYITRLEDGVDKDGNTFLKAKGYNAYKSNGRVAYNSFSKIKLYPISQEQMDATKERLFSQPDLKPKLQIVAYQSELSTPLINGKILPSLTVYRYDFAHHKLYKKRDLLNKGE